MTDPSIWCANSFTRCMNLGNIIRQRIRQSEEAIYPFYLFCLWKHSSTGGRIWKLKRCPFLHPFLLFSSPRLHHLHPISSHPALILFSLLPFTLPSYFLSFLSVPSCIRCSYSPCPSSSLFFTLPAAFIHWMNGFFVQSKITSLSNGWVYGSY